MMRFKLLIIKTKILADAMLFWKIKTAHSFLGDLEGVIGLYILIDLEIHIVFINPNKIYRFSNSLGLVFKNPVVFPRI